MPVEFGGSRTPGTRASLTPSWLSHSVDGSPKPLAPQVSLVPSPTPCSHPAPPDPPTVAWLSHPEQD
eukprot:3272394-Alexandrium_andersonii.AAC.1